ncbi:hypothetical protein [Spirosoma sp.]|uniref:hypothetical protein n=1 Tax=Spirosoma sp. TaxID=1899569 RepID=UPI002615B62C|nr:hypothetical protein [Spirosoma sp.]MCX6219111.1 hypothetical protein [Spirosoma sp.]
MALPKNVYRLPLEVLVEQFVQAYDFRLLVIDYKLCAVAQRIPTRVIGDGSSTISQLIDAMNSAPRRGDRHVNLLTRISIDEATLAILTEHNLTPESCCSPGKSSI